MPRGAGRPAPYVIFLHIPKTGGMTLRDVFKRRHGHKSVYQENFAFDPDDALWRYLSERSDEWPYDMDENALRLARWQALDPDERAEFTAFVGHFWFGVHELLPQPITYVTVLRDPVDRLLSLHAYRVERNDFYLPLERFLTNGRDIETMNGQTRRVASAGPGVVRGPVTQTMLDVAIENLATQFAAVGVTERYDETLIAFGTALGWPAIDYRVINRSTDRKAKNELAPAVLEHVLEQNQFDVELHRYAGELLDQSLVDIDVDAGRRQIARDTRAYRWRRRLRKSKNKVRRAAGVVKGRIRRT